MNAQEIAEKLNISENDFLNLVNQEIIAKGKNGKFDLEQSSSNYINHLQKIARKRKKNTPESTTYNNEKARLTRIQGNILELEIAIEKGEYINREIAIEQLVNPILNCRSRLLGFIYKFPSQAFGQQKSDMKEIAQKLIDEAIDELIIPDFKNIEEETEDESL